ncbi:MAG TPA: hypothetical protein VIJ25_06405, partial [Methylococcales bacterium]
MHFPTYAPAENTEISVARAYVATLAEIEAVHNPHHEKSRGSKELIDACLKLTDNMVIDVGPLERMEARLGGDLRDYPERVYHNPNQIAAAGIARIVASGYSSQWSRKGE